jgi:hypothetical protein
MTVPQARGAYPMHAAADVGAPHASQGHRGAWGRVPGASPALTKPQDGPAAEGGGGHA